MAIGPKGEEEQMQLQRILSLMGATSIVMATSACLPDHFGLFDGKKAQATIQTLPQKSIELRDAKGALFEVREKAVLSFEVNRLSNAILTLDVPNHRARFQVPKKVLNQSSALLSLKSTESGQPVDLRMKEGERVLSSWTKLREEEDPVYMTSCDSDNNCSTYIVGYTTYYYRDHFGIVDRAVDFEVFESGAAWQGFPEGRKLGVLHALVTHREEKLLTESISEATFREESIR